VLCVWFQSYIYIYIITAKAYDEATAGQHDAREEHSLGMKKLNICVVRDLSILSCRTELQDLSIVIDE
jgi:hypothetical protein